MIYYRIELSLRSEGGRNIEAMRGNQGGGVGKRIGTANDLNILMLFCHLYINFAWVSVCGFVSLLVCIQ